MPSQLGPLNASISFQGNIACGGSASLVLNVDGTCTFNGSFHDSGLVSYDVSLAMVVTSTSGKAFTFAKTGHVSGTAALAGGGSNSRNFTWADSAKNADVAAAWAELVAGSNSHWKADVNASVVDVLNDVVTLVKAIQPVITVVTAVIAAV